MKVLVFGANGQVGHELVQRGWPAGVRVIGVERRQADFARLDRIDDALGAAAPDIVINAAAYTAVDKAETQRDEAFAVNAVAVGHIAERCASRGIPLLHISTDYVFDGAGTRAYRETDAVSPLGVYGASKVAGEALVRANLGAHIILRTSWVYAARGQNFLRTMVRLARERDDVAVVADQHGAPTSAADIADVLSRIALAVLGGERAPWGDRWGTYHYTAAGVTSWHGFAEHIFDDVLAHGGRRPTCKAISTADYPTAARRPANSRLDCSAFDQTFAIPRNYWRVGVDRVLNDLRRSGE